MNDIDYTAMICRHKISWYFNDSDVGNLFPYESLPRDQEEHVRKMIEDDYYCGELCYSEDGEEWRGWWCIKD